MSLGIKKREAPIKNILGRFSKSDFKHDFSISPKTVINTLKQSVPIGENKVKYLKNVIELEKKLSGKSVYEFLKEEYKFILPENQDFEAESEDNLLKKILDIQYNTWRKELFDFTPNLKNRILPENKNIIINVNNVKRNYSVKFYPTKDKKTYYNIPSAFKNLTSKNKFVLIIDASFFPLSSIGVKEYLINQYIGDYNPEEKYEFYILENSENTSDSAKKIIKYASDNNNISIFILREKINTTIIYPVFNIHEEQDQKSNLFSDVEINSTKVSNNQVNATLIVDNVNYNIEDLGSISQIERASFIALQKYILNSNNVTKEMMSYFLLKRAGDWCQALSLLDFAREYELYDSNNTNTGRVETLTTLQQQDCVIGLVTHDRILLGYALLLGLNVFYSLKVVSTIQDTSDSNSINWCMYFQNASSEVYYIDIESIKSGEKRLYEYIDAAIVASKEYEIFISEKFTKKNIPFNDKSKLVDNIIKLRLLMIQLNGLYLEDSFKEKKDSLMNYYDKIRDLTIDVIETMSQEEKKEVSNNLSNIRSITRSINEMYTHNISIKELEHYDTESSEQKYIQTLKQTKSYKDIDEEKGNYKYFIVNEFKKDYLELKEKNLHAKINEVFTDIEHYGRDPKYKMMIDEFINIIEGKKYGGNGSLMSSLESLRSPEMNSEENNVEMNGKEENIRYFNDRYGNFYSNYGGIIITNEHAEILHTKLNLIKDKPIDSFNEEEKVFYKRFLIYYLDELFTRIFTLEGSITYNNNKKAEFNYDLYIEFLHIYVELYNLEDIYRNKKLPNELYNLYYINRYKYTSFYLEHEFPLDRYLNKDTINFNEITTRIYAKHENVRRCIIHDKCKIKAVKKRSTLRKERKNPKSRSMKREEHKRKSHSQRVKEARNTRRKRGILKGGNSNTRKYKN